MTSITWDPTTNGTGAHEVRVALVTGAAQGIGRGIALRLAHDGYKVAASDLPDQLSKLRELEQEIALSRSAEGTSQKGDGFFVAITGDVSIEGDVKAMLDKCVEVLGRLDVVSALYLLHQSVITVLISACVKMVANAGIGVVKPLLESKHIRFDFPLRRRSCFFVPQQRPRSSTKLFQ